MACLCGPDEDQHVRSWLRDESIPFVIAAGRSLHRRRPPGRHASAAFGMVCVISTSRQWKVFVRGGKNDHLMGFATLLYRLAL